MMSEEPAGPRISADGKFFWDGRAWAPMPEKRASSHSGFVGGVVMLVGAAVAVVGTLLPYAQATGAFGISLSRAGVQTDGIFVLIAAAICAAVAGGVFMRRTPGATALVVGFVCSFGTLGVLILVWIEIANSGAGIDGISVDTGPGVFLSGLGAIVAIAGCFITAQPEPGTPSLTDQALGLEPLPRSDIDESSAPVSSIDAP